MECSHVDGNLDKSKSDLIKLSEGNCCICKEPGPNLWACLKEGCQFVGCGESKKDHGSKHCEEHQHFVAVNLRSFRIWCYACQKEIHLRQYFTPDDMKRLKSAKSRKAIPGSACPTSKINSAKKLKPPIIHPSPPQPMINFTNLSSLLLLCNEVDNPVELDSTRGLTGLRNLGNTCYMNAALQSLSNCPQLSLYFMAMGKLHSPGQKLSMSTSYLKLVNDLWSPKRFSCVAPSSVHSTLRMINSSFRSYQQQDTQEFLRCFMDRLHEELKFAVPVDDPHSLPQFQEAGDAANVLSIPRIVTPLPSGDETMSMTISTSSEESFKSCHSMEVEVVELDSVSMDDESEEQPMIERSNVTFPQELDQLHASASPLFRSTSMPSIGTSNSQQPSFDQRSITRKRTVSSRSTTQIETGLNTSRRSEITQPKKKIYKYQSVISDIFDGEIRSSVQCRTCCSISHTRETFQDLSLPIPGKDDTARLHGFSQTTTLPMTSSTPPPSGPCANTEGYQTRIYYLWDWLKSWLWGPDVNLSDCLAAFFSADELKGDNMYSCEKCKKLRNGVKYCRLLKLPEVLCIHLKRFRHEYLTSYSTKISSTVTFPLQGLDLSCYVAKDNVSENMVYDLSSVIIHHGGAGGGHYTSYCKNPLNGKWYEFDDQYVTEVSQSTVAAAEAYVLFYRKQDEEAGKFREQVVSLDGAKEPVLMRYYVAVEWMIQFLTFAESGPIDNSYFLCQHENLKPHLVESVGERVCCVSEQTWRVMHERLGGGPAVTHLQPCMTCIHEEKVLEERRLAEKEMYLKLSETSQELGKTSTYYISMDWFRIWQNFIHAKEKEPPGEINNQPIAVVRDGKFTLKKGGDYGEIASEAWTYLLDTYGGGPAIPNNNNIYQNDGRCINDNDL